MFDKANCAIWLYECLSCKRTFQVFCSLKDYQGDGPPKELRCIHCAVSSAAKRIQRLPQLEVKR